MYTLYVYVYIICVYVYIICVYVYIICVYVYIICVYVYVNAYVCSKIQLKITKILVNNYLKTET